MEETRLTEQSFQHVKDIFSGADAANLFFKERIAILVILEYVKAKDWPWKGLPLSSEPLQIPLVWALFYASSNGNFNMVWDIHPMKCFPRLYNRYNSHSKSSGMPIVTSGGATLAGCSRALVIVCNRRYEVNSKTPEYCSIFGLPDDCYDPDFEKRMLDTLKRHQNLNLWCFEKSEYLGRQIEPHIVPHYMKGEFLPSRNFIYIDTPEHFLTGVFGSKELQGLSAEPWYSTGRELIEEMNLDSEHSYRFEEKANYYIRKRLVNEFVRLSLLLTKKDSFSSFLVTSSPPLESTSKAEVQTRLQNILTMTKRDNELRIYNTVKEIRQQIDLQSLGRHHFMVMDIEYIHVTYPTNRKGFFNFPCIFSSIIWRGAKEGLEIHTNVFVIPCHFCSQPCKVFKKNFFNFSCLSFGFEFIETQVSLVEELLSRYEGFKIYTYGRSDAFQLEQGSNFFSDSFQRRLYERRNRKRAKRIIDISKDLSVPDMGLSDIEHEILGKWLVGWSRKQGKVNVNSRFMTRYGRLNWETNYSEAIDSCVSDTASAFFYLLHKKYRVDDGPAKEG